MLICLHRERKERRDTHMEKEKDFISKFSELTEENQRYVVAVQQALIFAQSTSERIDQQENKTSRGEVYV